MNKLLRLSWPLVLLLLAGCMPSRINILPDPTDDAQLVSANNGVLVLQVADTTPFGIGVPVNQVTLAPKDVNVDDDSKFPRMLALEDVPGQSTKIFQAVLPAGEYSIASLRAYYQFGEAYFSRFYPAGIDLGTFRVEPGKVTDLGILAVYIRRSGEDYLFETVRTAGEPRALKLLAERRPGLAARIENRDAPRSWDPDGNDGDRRSGYVNAVNRQIVFAEPSIDSATGALRFPSRLGVIVARDNDGAWRLDSIPLDVELRQIVRIGDDDVVLTEFGDILARRDGGTEWREIGVPPVGDGELRFIDSHHSGPVFAVSQEHNTATIWSAPALGDSWTRVVSIERELGFFESLDKSLFAIDKGMSGATYAAHGDFLYLALGKDMYRFDQRTRQYDVLDTPNPESVQIRNGILTIRTSSFSGSRVSFDDGSSWQRYAGRFIEQVDEESQGRRRSQRYRQERRAARLLGHPVFVDTQLGYAIHEELSKNAEPFLVRTEDGAETWRAATATALPEGCGRLVLASQTELLLGCFLSGEFYRSSDGGETWEVDRDVAET